MSQASAPSEVNASGETNEVIKPGWKELLLIIFIHGFRGTESTFGEFPKRLEHILSETIDSLKVETVVFPVYETKGELDAAVEKFADWLATLTVQREVANGEGGGAGKAKIVLCGHSMGGLLAADALLAMVHNRPDKKAPLWPNVIACLAFDTPYLGLHPFVFKSNATKAVEYAETARKFAGVFGLGAATNAATSSTQTSLKAITAPPASPSSWATWGPAALTVGGTLLAGAAAGAAFYKRDELTSGYTWATDHMKYVGNLWNESALHKRVEGLLEVDKELSVTFRTFYTYLPPSPPQHLTPRTFINLPKKTNPVYPYFLPARNGLAADEVQSHMWMFTADTNDGYYELGLSTAKIIRDAISSLRDDEGRGDDKVVEELACETA